MNRISQLLIQTKYLNWQEKLIYLSKNFKNSVFSTSFSIEDQVITDFIIRQDLNIKIFTIDTGRLPAETHQVWQSSIRKYGAKFKIYHPDQENIATYTSNNGTNAFYEDFDLRKQCCFIRKIEPLKRALKNQDLWISGVRKEHSASRKSKDFIEFDEDLSLIKFYPLLEESIDGIWSYINKNSVPFNILYKQGYHSIGCAPCSRAISPGQDIRDGRWWWENNNNKECGLHK